MVWLFYTRARGCYAWSGADLHVCVTRVIRVCYACVTRVIHNSGEECVGICTEKKKWYNSGEEVVRAPTGIRTRDACSECIQVVTFE